MLYLLPACVETPSNRTTMYASFHVAYMDVGKEREQGCGSFAYMDVGKEREQGRGSLAMKQIERTLKPKSQTLRV